MWLCCASHSISSPPLPLLTSPSLTFPKLIILQHLPFSWWLWSGNKWYLASVVQSLQWRGVICAMATYRPRCNTGNNPNASFLLTFQDSNSNLVKNMRWACGCGAPQGVCGWEVQDGVLSLTPSLHWTPLVGVGWTHTGLTDPVCPAYQAIQLLFRRCCYYHDYQVCSYAREDFRSASERCVRYHDMV